MVHLIKSIIEVEPFKIKLLFNTGEVKVIDFEAKIREKCTTSDSKYRELLQPGFFCSVKLHPEWETIYWDNGIDFCPDMLYMQGSAIDFIASFV